MASASSRSPWAATRRHRTGNQVSWQAVNDLSAHPATTGAPYQGNSVILNALGDLTNRENRFAYQRFSSDFQNLAGALVPGGDGLSDDLNGDNVPDYYPDALSHGPGADQHCRPAHLRSDPRPPAGYRPR